MGETKTPKISVRLPNPEPSKDGIYTITNVEEVTVNTPSGPVNGFRVSLKDDNNNLYSTMLWNKETASKKSKIGSFVSALGPDTDNWINHRVLFSSWTEKDRVVKDLGKVSSQTGLER